MPESVERLTRDQCLQKATECREMANYPQLTPQQRVTLLDIAESCKRLAQTVKS